MPSDLQLCCGEFLHNVSRLGIEDEEERFVREARDFFADSVYVIDRVAFRELEIWLQGSRSCFGKGTAPGFV